MAHTPAPWPIDWYECRADSSDVDFAKTEGRAIKVGDVLWRVPLSIGPITIDHNHWAGYHLDINEHTASLVSETPAMADILRDAVNRFDRKRYADDSLFEDMYEPISAARAILARIEGRST